MNAYLVTQLRNAHDNGALCREAADEIERLRAARVHLLLDLRDAMRAMTDLVRLTDECPNCDGLREQPALTRFGSLCASPFHVGSPADAVMSRIAHHFNAVDNRHEK